MHKKLKRLWEEKIWKLLLKQSAPAVIWMLVMSLYNFVDTIFVGRGVGTEWIAALSIIFPIQMIIWAFSMSLWIWSASIISRKLWEKKIDYVNKVFWTFQSSNIIIAIIFSIFWLLFASKLLIFFGANKEILLYAKEYFSILLIWIVFLCFNMWNNNIIRSTWHAKISMIVMISSALLNTILDPILIFWFDMWMSWAAWATVVSWILATIFIIIYYFSKYNLISPKINDFIISLKKLKEIVLIWSSSLVRQVSTSWVVVLINIFLWLYWWSMAIAAYGIINRALMVFMMPMFGILQWMQPILWYNYWAGFKHRVKQVTILSIKVLTIFSTIVFAILFFKSGFILSLFSKDLELISIASSATKIIILMFPIIWFQIIASWFYQSLWKVKKAFLFAIFRQVLLFIPIIILFSKIFWLSWIWYSFPISDLLAWIFTFVIFYKDMNRIT